MYSRWQPTNLNTLKNVLGKKIENFYPHENKWAHSICSLFSTCIVFFNQYIIHCCIINLLSTHILPELNKCYVDLTVVKLFCWNHI